MNLFENLGSMKVAQHLRQRGPNRIYHLDMMFQGVRYRASLHTTDKRDATQRAVDHLIKEMDKNTGKVRVSMKLSDLRQKVSEHNRSNGNHHGKVVDLAFRRLIEVLTDIEISQVGVEEVNKYRLALHNFSRTTKSGVEEKLSGKTINANMECVRSGFSYAVYNKWIKENPFSKFIRATEEVHAANPYKPALARAIVDEAARLGNDLDKVILLMLYTAMRASEAISLTFKDVDFEDATITLIAKHTKMKRKRIIPLNRECLESLRYMQAHYDKPVPFTLQQIEKMFREIREKLGFEGIFEDFRSTCNTWLKYHAKLPDSACEKILGHVYGNNVNTTYYTGFVPEEVRRAMEVLSDVLHSAPPYHPLDEHNTPPPENEERLSATETKELCTDVDAL